MENIPVIVITGTCGAGKTSVAFAVGDGLRAKQIAHAVVDMDSLRNVEPAPPDDPFHVQLGLRNLAAIWENCRQVGTEWLVLADIVETSDDVSNYHCAIPNAEVVVVRLRVSRAENERRLRGRETPSSIEWYLHRSAELAELMESRGIGDILVDTDGRDVGDIAEEILQKVFLSCRDCL